MNIEIILGLAIVGVVFFTGLKFLETHYIDKDKRALKFYISDAVFAFLSFFV